MSQTGSSQSEFLFKTLTEAHVADLESREPINSMEDEDYGESADVFADIGSDIMPWKRRSSMGSSSAMPGETPPSAKNRTRYELDNTMYKDISDLTRSIYESFNKRENDLRASYAKTRFFMVENFCDTELIKFEMLMKELRDRSFLKDAEDIDIKLAPIDPMVSIETLKDKKISDIRTTWLMKVLKASDDYLNKSNLVRSMFRRTHEFFNELNEMEYQFLTKKHLREISKQDILHKLRVRDDQSSHVTERLNSVEIAQQKEVQWIQFKHLKEVYVRMVQKEWAAMDNHLSMLEEQYQSLQKIYIDIMNMKIDSVKDWVMFRHKKDAQLKEATTNLRNSCFDDFRAYRDGERSLEMKDMKSSANEERTKRFDSFSDMETVMSSELVFGMTMKRQKTLYIIDDVSSDGTFDVDNDEDMRVLDGKNAEFLTHVRKRIRKKSQIENKYNEVLKGKVVQLDAAEDKYLEENRKKEREHMKSSMERYFQLEKRLEEQLEKFLRKEKHAIDNLKKTQQSDMESILNTHDAELRRIMNTEGSIQKKLETVYSMISSSKEQQRDTMITAHVFHEIRNVLASILCLGENAKENPTELDSIISEQGDVCNYALETMNDMLDVAKIKTSSYAVREDVVNMSQLIDEVIKIQGQRAKPGVTVVKVVNDVTEIVTEKRLLRQLLVNLLSNACKFTKKGQITLFATAVFRARVACIKIGVADTGAGLTPSITSKINDSSIENGDIVNGFIDTHSEQGTVLSDMNEYTARSSGYGLYLASTISKTLGGSLKVISPLTEQNARTFPRLQDCAGSCFYTIIPKRVAGKEASVVSDTTVEEERAWTFCPRGHMKVLIVDDQKLLRHAMISIFKKLCEMYEGFTVDISTACSAEEGLRKQKMDPFDLIALDEHYDQSVLAKNALSRKSSQGGALSLGPSVEENTERCIAFKKDEKFHILATDGVLLGTEVAHDMCGGKAKPIVFSCTGSAQVRNAFILTKPYTVQRFVDMMNQHATGFIKRGMVQEEGEVAKKNEKLTLYTRIK